MAGSPLYDVVVVGAGIEGSATAYQLAKKGTRTLLLEQFPLPHSRGSSHGQSRITRKAYGDQDFYTNMMQECYDVISELERKEGKKLFTNCGMLSIGPKGTPIITGTLDSLTKHRVPYEHFNNIGIKRKYPMMSFPPNYEYVLDKSGGVLMADKVLQAFQNQFQACMGTLHDGEPVTDVSPGDVITVTTTKSMYRCKSLVLALGPWAPKFLQRLGLSLPLQPVRISVCYWREKQTGEHTSSEFPTFLVDSGTGNFEVYGLPVEEYPGLVKICLHSGPAIDPDARDNADNGWVMKTITKFVSDHFPNLNPKPSIVETCIYTNTPDADFILDVHPKWKNIVIGAGFSGHGFKLAPVVGKLLAELATGQAPSYDISHFKMDRFKKKAKL